MKNDEGEPSFLRSAWSKTSFLSALILYNLCVCLLDGNLLYDNWKIVSSYYTP